MPEGLRSKSGSVDTLTPESGDPTDLTVPHLSLVITGCTKASGRAGGPESRSVDEPAHGVYTNIKSDGKCCHMLSLKVSKILLKSSH